MENPQTLQVLIKQPLRTAGIMPAVIFGLVSANLAWELHSTGWLLHGGLLVFGGTFFVFSDYLRPAMRLASLITLPVTYVLTHDSIAVTAELTNAWHTK